VPVVTDHSAPQGEPRPMLRHLTVERERSLRQRLVARDERALAELIEVATPWLLGVAQSMLTDSQEAEDVVQDVFVRLWQQDLAGTEGEGRILPWLLRVTRTRTIDRLRSRKRRETLETNLVRRGDAALHVPAHEPNDAAIPGWHVHRGVHEALNHLPAAQREVVQLAYFEGLTQSEVAARTGLPLGTVKTRTRLAFDQLRTELASMKDWLA